MFDFTIPEGKNTPHIQFYAKDHCLELVGKSYPENARKFYDEIMLHFKAHLFGSNFKIKIDLDYISSSSVISVLELIKKLKNQAGSTHFVVDFYYDEGDDDMLAIGENYKKISGLEFNFIER